MTGWQTTFAVVCNGVTNWVVGNSIYGKNFLFLLDKFLKVLGACIHPILDAVILKVMQILDSFSVIQSHCSDKTMGIVTIARTLWMEGVGADPGFLLSPMGGQ